MAAFNKTISAEDKLILNFPGGLPLSCKFYVRVAGFTYVNKIERDI